MGFEEQLADGDLASWITEARRRTATEFRARYSCLFFLVHEGDRDEERFSFQTTDIESTVLKISVAQWDQLKIRVVPIAKSPRSPYQDRISVGRTPNCDVVIRHPSVSKLHAHIRKVHEGHMLIDLGSHNGTRLRDSRLVPNTPEPLRPNDSVVFGVVGARTFDAEALHTMLSRLAAIAKVY